MNIFKHLNTAECQNFREIALRYSNRINEILKNSELTKKQYLFKNNDLTRIKHWGYDNITNSSKSLGYETSYDAAYNNAFYRRDIVVNKFLGEKKQTTLLEINEKEMIFEGKERDINISKIIAGALSKGYDEKILSKDIINIIKNIEEQEMALELELSTIKIFEDKKDVIKEVVNTLILLNTDVQKEMILATCEFINKEF
jgi:hypothetical protein